MEITGKVVHVLPEQSGTTSKGQWRKKEFVVEVAGTYPKKVCIALYGDDINKFKVNTGESVKASVNIESREYNSKWYTNISAWKIDKGAVGEAELSSDIDSTDSLPF